MYWNGNGPMAGMHFAFPDVCLVPGPFGPIPMPFPNIVQTPMAMPNQQKVMLMGMPSHNLMTKTALSQGDEAGTMGGVVSHTGMGPACGAMGSSNVILCGAPVAKFGMPTKQNGTVPNAVGMTIAPSQTKVMSMR